MVHGGSKIISLKKVQLFTQFAQAAKIWRDFLERWDAKYLRFFFYGRHVPLKLSWVCLWAKIELRLERLVRSGGYANETIASRQASIKGHDLKHKITYFFCLQHSNANVEYSKQPINHRFRSFLVAFQNSLPGLAHGYSGFFESIRGLSMDEREKKS